MVQAWNEHNSLIHFEGCVRKNNYIYLLVHVFLVFMSLFYYLSALLLSYHCKLIVKM